MPQIGQLPGASRTISGCIGQVYWPPFFTAGAVRWGVEGACFARYFAGSAELRAKNAFTFGPIVEVAVLFAGIFATMTPVLELLNANAPSLGLSTPRQFFWTTGALSSLLDNAPTYLAFASAAAGLQNIPPHGAFIGGIDPAILAAISTGAVFMGANTYIGNAPNFMVKAIAEESGVKMPSFFGYMAYSVGILLPLFVIVSVVFFRS